jgi:hypothetical protein
MATTAHKIKVAVEYGLLLWVIGFIWSVIVYMIPMLRNIHSIFHLAKFPAISVPLLICYAVLLFYLSKRYFREINANFIEGFWLAVIILVLNLVLDFLVYFIFFAARDYFSYLSIWLCYFLFMFIPIFYAEKCG